MIHILATRASGIPPGTVHLSTGLRRLRRSATRSRTTVAICTTPGESPCTQTDSMLIGITDPSTAVTRPTMVATRSAISAGSCSTAPAASDRERGQPAGFRRGLHTSIMEQESSESAAIQPERLARGLRRGDHDRIDEWQRAEQLRISCFRCWPQTLGQRCASVDLQCNTGQEGVGHREQHRVGPVLSCSDAPRRAGGADVREVLALAPFPQQIRGRRRRGASS